MNEGSANLYKNLADSQLELYPFPHFLVKDALPKVFLRELKSDLELLEETEPTKHFISQFGEKKEWRTFPGNLIALNDFLNFFGGSQFIELLKEKFGILSSIELTPDFSYDGGGYVISPPGAFLAYHADFNYSSNVMKYRVINVLIYMNDNYEINQGGELHILDPESKTVERRVQPDLGTILAFYTDDTSFHGVSKNREGFFRRSFNLYYYAAEPISSNQSKTPHKTIWLDFDSHKH